jgi:hypothetical protein
VEEAVRACGGRGVSWVGGVRGGGFLYAAGAGRGAGRRVGGASDRLTEQDREP